MRARSPNVFVPAVLLVMLLGASSTAYADAFSITSFSFTNLQFTAAAGTATFTLTSAQARANASNNVQTQDNISNSFPIAQSNAAVDVASAAATANATTRSLSGETTASIGGCSCAAGSFALGILNGTLVLSGAEGPVNVDISALQTLLWQVQTDQSGVYAESGLFFDMFVNGTPVFSLQVEALHPITGPNGFGSVSGSSQIARTITLQGGSTNTISIRLTATSLVINEVPEPATVVLLVSGLGVMTGVLKKRLKKS